MTSASRRVSVAATRRSYTQRQPGRTGTAQWPAPRPAVSAAAEAPQIFGTTTAPYFAVKGLTVVSCPWQFGEVASDHIRATLAARRTSTPEMRERFAGVMQTIWSDTAGFLDQYYGRVPPDRERGDPIACCKRYLAELKELSGKP